MKHVLAIEVAGNQAYIYRSNKLRESIGASEILHAIGTSWIRDAVKDSSGTEVVISTSSKAVLVGDQENLKRILTAVTTRALIEAPGVDVVGAIVPIEGSFFASLREAFRRIGTNRSRLNGPECRFPRVPTVDSCASTGGPAQVVGRDGALATLEVLAKRNHAEDGYRRMKVSEARETIFRNLEQLEDFGFDSDWIAVVHADGNGLGHLFLNFDEHLRRVGRSDAVDNLAMGSDLYRRFSVAVEKCTRAAYESAVIYAGDHPSRRGIVPVLIGGDDITAIVTGNAALPFAKKYCEEFAEVCASDPVLKELQIRGLTASASIVWTKPHFPYWSSYEMAADLLARAKSRGREMWSDVSPSLLDLRVMYDSSTVGSMNATSGRPDLNAGPFYVGRGEESKDLWAISDLEACLALLDGSDKRSSLPGSAIHSVRDHLTTSGVVSARRRIDELEMGDPARATQWRAVKNFVPETDDPRSVLLVTAMDLNGIVEIDHVNSGGAK